jgi:hypothetical protein
VEFPTTRYQRRIVVFRLRAWKAQAPVQAASRLINFASHVELREKYERISEIRTISEVRQFESVVRAFS